ncbi:lactococcin G-beta/enterocin 1071B family bacteriocin [Leuconostoc gelidum]|nr:lactococcin G-beta/enterocin 1071B family bacteriocin [Leuconostoc gelidum]MBZ5992259.1 lactococcin G-beta/enterocin 1071B family bacteriocin [Leuconostoc gelidum subsp. gelidum]USP17280.1 lactococcin G-beta/enterocin 1071B family bacteriocin [Leuconostoc gelidum subsp. aenigmaticum]GMA67201.1 hypothetical protein GCM10025884_08280 [Leuconostoc gelidum subsp. gelidum]
MNDNVIFNELTETELSSISGGKGWGWVGLIEPAWDFGGGVVKGFSKHIK